MVQVRDVMSATVVTVPVGTGVVEAAQIMVGREKGRRPDVDNNPLALHPIELVLVLSQLLTLALWVVLLRGVIRHHWPVGPVVVLGLLALIPLFGPIAGAAALYVSVRRGSRARRTA